MTEDSVTEHDVAIVGGGPVGLLLACLLVQEGVDVGLYEKRSAPPAGTRAIGIHPPGLAALRRVHLDAAVREEALRLERGIARSRGRTLAELPLDDGGACVLTLPQWRIETLLRERLAALAPDALRLGEGVESVREEGTHMSLSLSAQNEVRARLVVAADGVRSGIRSGAGIGWRKRPGHGRYAMADTDDTTGLGTEACLFCEPDGIVESFPLPGARRRWVARLGARTAGQTLAEVVGARTGHLPDIPDAAVSLFAAAQHRATRLVCGRLVLVGDAAHVRTPGGNLGEGFGDVANLGWKLAAVLQGQGGEALLDSYDQERRRHNWRIANTAFARAERGKALLAEVREIGVPDDEDLSADAVARRERIGALLADRRSGGVGTTFDERYDASSTVWYEPGQIAEEPAWAPDRYTPEGRPGHRAPDGYVDPFGDTLYDRIGLTLSLIVFGEDRTVESSFVAEARERGLALSVIHLDHPEAAALYGAGNALVRPDQHVVWRGERLPEGGAAVVLDHVLGVATVDEVRAQGAHDDVADREAPAREQFPA